MKRFLMVIILVCLTLGSMNNVAVAAGESKPQFQVLRNFGLVQSTILVEQVKEYVALREELHRYSAYNNALLDLVNSLLKYGQRYNEGWQRKDLSQIAAAIKSVEDYLRQNGTFVWKVDTGLGYELEVIHEHERPGLFLYKNPFKHDIDGDGEIDVYDEDEYMRQYVSTRLDVSGPQTEGAVKIKAGLNYFGAGYLEDDGRFSRETDLQFPHINDFVLSLYGEHFTATIGEKQILGLRDYLYYDDPNNPDDYNLSGITFQAPYGIFFGLGQETIPYAPDQTKMRDVRWIAVGTEGLGFLPVNLYLTEQEFQSPDFHKVGRNVVFALTTDMTFPGLLVKGDLGVNDSGDGFFSSVEVEGKVEQLTMQGKLEVSDHFTPIQPKGDFTNTTYTRTFYDGEKFAFPARTQRGVEMRGSYQVRPDFEVYGTMQKYLDAHDYTLAVSYLPIPELQVQLAGKYDELHGGDFSTEIESSYIQPYGSLYARKVFGGTGDLELKAEPLYGGKTVTVKGIFSFGMRPGTELTNSRMGVEVDYHPNDYFTFAAKYMMEDMDYDVDLPGLNFTRNGKIEYQFNQWVSAHVTFENIEFRNPKHGYLVEYTKGGVSVNF